MFVHECTVCRRRQLVFPSQFASVAATTAGAQVTFTCWCGAEQSSVMGSLLDEELPVAA